MTSFNFKKFIATLNTKTVFELKKLQTFNMYNTDHSMWIDPSTFDFTYDAIRPEWTASEVV